MRVDRKTKVGTKRSQARHKGKATRNLRGAGRTTGKVWGESKTKGGGLGAFYTCSSFPDQSVAVGVIWPSPCMHSTAHLPLDTMATLSTCLLLLLHLCALKLIFLQVKIPSRPLTALMRILSTTPIPRAPMLPIQQTWPGASRNLCAGKQSSPQRQSI